MGKRSLAAFVLCISIAGLVVVPAAPAGALNTDESCFFSAINRERASAGRPKLALKGDLTFIARRHSRRMAEDRTIYHNRNLGNEVPGNWSAAGENVGMGPSCKSIHDAFMSSPGHRANILDRDYNQAGVGVAYDDEGTIYVTEVFAKRRTASVTRAPAPRVQRKPRAARAQPPRAPPKPALIPPPPRTVAMMLLLLGLDARRVNPLNGRAIGV